MDSLKLNINNVLDFVPEDNIFSLAEKAIKCNKALEEKSGKGKGTLQRIKMYWEIFLAFFRK